MSIRRIPVFLTLMTTLGLSLSAYLILCPVAKSPAKAQSALSDSPAGRTEATIALRHCSSFDKAIGLVLKHEGHLANNPKDPGGITNYGLSYRYLDDLVKRHPDLLKEIDANGNKTFDAYDVSHMTLDEAKALYKEEWWDLYRFGDICDQKLAMKLFDLSVNMGEGHVLTLLNKAYMNRMKTAMPHNYLDAINALTSEERADLLMGICFNAQEYYIQLSQKHPAFKVFLKGWLKRVWDMG